MAGRMRRFTSTMVCLAAAWMPMLGHPSVAWADEPVTYEVVSQDIQAANIEYQASAGRVSAKGVTLPWRIDAIVHTVRGAPPEGSQVRADWRPYAAPARWVSVRIIYQGKVICQNTLDVGDAACYGITPRIT